MLSAPQGTVTVRVYGSGAEVCEENDLIAPTLRKFTRELLFAKDPRFGPFSLMQSTDL
jgi:hypothetical protein